VSALDDAVDLLDHALRDLDRASAKMTEAGRPGYAEWAERTGNELSRLVVQAHSAQRASQ